MKTLLEVFYLRTMKDTELMKSTRKSLGLTQSQMAERLGYGNQKDISNIETGKENMSNQTRQHLLTIRKHELSNEAG
jgi:transcriptional regulator with XRE-family HTH domain